jgi:hypothetical protein
MGQAPVKWVGGGARSVQMSVLLLLLLPEMDSSFAVGLAATRNVIDDFRGVRIGFESGSALRSSRPTEELQPASSRPHAWRFHASQVHSHATRALS